MDSDDEIEILEQLASVKRFVPKKLSDIDLRIDRKAKHIRNQFRELEFPPCNNYRPRKSFWQEVLIMDGDINIGSAAMTQAVHNNEEGMNRMLSMEMTAGNDVDDNDYPYPQQKNPSRGCSFTTIAGACFLATFLVSATLAALVAVRSEQQTSRNHFVRIKYTPAIINEDTVRYTAFEYDAINRNVEEIPLTVLRWAEIMQEDIPAADRTREDFSNILRNSRDQAYLFETKGANSESWSKQFEFVLVNKPELATFAEKHADMTMLESNLRCAPLDAPGCSFSSDVTDYDSVLVAPRRQRKNVPDASYSHLAVFCREAPPDQVHAFWKLVAEQYSEALEKTRTTGYSVWLYTGFDDLAWLHFRLDTRPIDYGYDEFANET